MNQVRVSGTVQPHRVESISTGINGKISELNVATGDRVEEGQVLALVDASELQGELDQQTETQHGLVDTAQNQVRSAQSELDLFRKGLENGTNAEVRAAESALRTAQEQENLARGDLAAKQRAVGSEEAPSAQEIAAAESTLRLAQQATADAQVGVTSARDAAQAQLQTLELRLQEANGALDGARKVSEQTLGQLQKGIDSAELKAPFAGVVMGVTAQAGAKAEGALMKIGDDSKLTITTTVSESDIARIEEGDQVTFTSAASGSQEYTGVVTQVSRIAGAALPSGSGAEGEAPVGGNSGEDFGVQIEVTGSHEGLYIGSKVKAQIITEEANDAMSLPRDAVYVNDAGQQSVILAQTRGDKVLLEERAVQTGVQNDMDVEITGGDLSEGDIVIVYAETYRPFIGQELELLTEQAWG